MSNHWELSDQIRNSKTRLLNQRGINRFNHW